jgi:hypothetical protein
MNRAMSSNLALAPHHASLLVPPHASKSHAPQPQILYDAAVPLGDGFSELELAFFIEGDAMSARHDAEAAELARLGRSIARPRERWWRRLFAWRQRFAPAILAWE